MTEWKAKRFWKKTAVTEDRDGFGIALDDRPVRTPNKNHLIVPTQSMAQAIAAEWDAQGEDIDPLSMPVTRGANSALEKVAPQRDAVVAGLAEYGDSDLLCYRAAGPAGLVARQREAWDPLLDWAARELNAPLISAEGVMHVAQPPESLARLERRVADLSNFEIAGFHDLVALSGSLVMALAVIDAHLAPEVAWDISRIDEDWQIAQWGEDEEASVLTERKKEAFVAGSAFVSLARG
ncbi:MAG: ATPase [Loktanella sp.]|nr:ATPase [Loktanella sp.]